MKRKDSVRGLVGEARLPYRVTPVNRHGLVTDSATSLRLSRQRQSGTSPELAVRSVARALGSFYRVENRDLPGAPDLANRRRRWAVFVHGCFWHRHARCSKATLPVRNRSFWIQKFEANRRRDARGAAALRALGFRVLILWECQVAKPVFLQSKLKKFLG